MPSAQPTACGFSLGPGAYHLGLAVPKASTLLLLTQLYIQNIYAFGFSTTYLHPIIDPPLYLNQGHTETQRGKIG